LLLRQTQIFMSKNRIILYIILAVFHVGAFIFTLVIQDLSIAMQMIEHVSWFKFIAFFGIVLVAIDFIWSWIANSDSKKEKAALTHELNTLKAKLFDLQEVAKAEAAKSAAAKSAPKN
jgi:ABC-type transport system involved in cytochrome bd biosynthesis fused ATPase/permease subunit